MNKASPILIAPLLFALGCQNDVSPLAQGSDIPLAPQEDKLPDEVSDQAPISLQLKKEAGLVVDLDFFREENRPGPRMAEILLK